MNHIIIPVTPFQQNCSLIWCKQTNKAAIVDPGGDLERILSEVEKQGVVLDKILLTHGHIDHVGAAKALSTTTGLDIYGPHEADQFWLDNLPTQSQNFGFPVCESFVPQHYLKDGDTIEIGELKLQVYHCPGHTPGHVIFFDPKAKKALVGDVLFKGSIGRTDFPQSSHSDLINSITGKLWPLGNDVEFIPGHGPNSTFGDERQTNPFVADQLIG